MVEGPAVTLDDDHAPAVRIDALEMFVDLLARVEEDGSSEEFYGRLCEAACALTSMERAVLFRYDETQRRVRAAGSHNLPLDVFAGTHLSVETRRSRASRWPRIACSTCPRAPTSGCPSATARCCATGCSCARRSPPAGAGPA